MILRQKLSQIWGNIQYKLFPELEEGMGELSKTHQKLISILELIRIEEFIPSYFGYPGRPLKNRGFISRAFIAKIVFKLQFTRQIIDYLKSDKQLRRICGWDSVRAIPDESTFSRAFNEFAETKLAERVHQALIQNLYEGEIVGHVTKDSTAIEAREKAIKKEKKAKKKKKGEINRRQKQLGMTLEQMEQDLPKHCDIGVKKNAKGHTTFWRGYKLHVAIDDHCIPLSSILTSASLNDCEVAIPLATKCNKVAVNLYDLMDSAYDHKEIKEHSKLLGHVAIIDRCPSGKKEKNEKEEEEKRKRLLNFEMAEDIRYQERSKAERFNALYKDYFGGRTIRYRGYLKIGSEVMFGVLSLAASLLLNLVN